IFLSDRVIVMSPSPGRVDLDLLITISRPRRLAMRYTGEFADYTADIRAAFARRGVLREEP
ncbi:MAG: ABC transporter ATP-binding protein, partial [Candidatus Dormibacteraceae bacterium]